MTTIAIHEPKAVYAALEDQEALKHGPVFLEKDGQPMAVLLSIEAYSQLAGKTKSDEWVETADIPHLELADRRPPLTWREEQLRLTRADHDAFLRLLPELLKEHRGEWVAIHQSRVVALGYEFGELVEKMREDGYQDFYVQKIGETLRTIELPLEAASRA